ncbi:MAG: prepilin-type N-terminal cleavage/methylation domain-containing protein [Phycisphaeraceae bacterium]|nr:prepilin-type N-terminal cleavage/methylation domain-containing protein [Phycisphaeraceae bacterium]
MNPRGVTLLELLVAISIILVVSALSLPAIQGRLGDARSESARELIDSASLASRAESIRRGRPVELVARTGAEGTELLIRDVQSEAASGDGRGASPAAEREPPRRSASRAPAETRMRVWGVLPAGMRVEGAAGPRNANPNADPESPRGDAVPIGIFLPDGTAQGTGQAILTDGVHRLGISINGWAGGASFAPVVEQDQPEDERPALGGEK